MRCVILEIALAHERAASAEAANSIAAAADCDAARADADALAERLERAAPDLAAAADHDAALTLAHKCAASAEATIGACRAYP